MTHPWTLTIPESLYKQLQAHLFPGDGDEHGGVITAGVAHGERGTRLLARDFVPAIDGTDYLSGERGTQPEAYGRAVEFVKGGGRRLV